MMSGFELVAICCMDSDFGYTLSINHERQSIEIGVFAPRSMDGPLPPSVSVIRINVFILLFEKGTARDDVNVGLGVQFYAQQWLTTGQF